MPTMIQIRNVPDEMHREIKSRAALAGMSMSEYLLREIRKSLARPPREVLLARLAALPKVEALPFPTELVRESGDNREWYASELEESDGKTNP